jgi:prepilin-type N-terminal cleavage/methylation domain-containing protein
MLILKEEVFQMNKKGFTLIELLAVIIILAIVLAIAIPFITGIIDKATKDAFASDAKMVIKTIDFYKATTENLNITTATLTELGELLNIPTINYESIDISEDDGVISVFIVGKNKWAGLIAYGTINNMIVINEEDFTIDVNIEFVYTGDEQTWIVPFSGRYKIEVWGAQGGHPHGGNGGYAWGEIILDAGDIMRVYVGEAGSYSESTGSPATFNGGGSSGRNAGSGGGATDVRRNGTELTDRIIVAGGGGGGWCSFIWSGLCQLSADIAYGGDGGGLIGGNAFYYETGYGETFETLNTGATQSGGHALGIGEGKTTLDGTGAGGGYWGGRFMSISWDFDQFGSGGGSSYVGGMINDGTRGTTPGIRIGNGLARITSIN